MVSVRKNIKRMLLFEYIRYRFAVVFLSNQGTGVMLAISRQKNVNRFYINFIVCLTVSTTTLFLVNWGVGLTGMSNWEKNNWMHGDVILILITVHIYQRNGQIVCRGWGKERCVMNMGYLPFLFLPFVVVVWTDLLFAWIYICICKGKQVMPRTGFLN